MEEEINLNITWTLKNAPTINDLSPRVPLSQRPPENVTGIKKLYKKRYTDKLQGKDTGI